MNRYDIDDCGDEILDPDGGWVKYEDHDAEIARLRAELDAAKQKLANTTKSAIDIFSSTFCERHQAEVSKESFTDFKAKEDAGGCPRCLRVELDAAKASDAALAGYLSGAIPELHHTHPELIINAVHAFRNIAAKENPNAKA